MLLNILPILFPECCFACRGALERGESSICTECRFNLPKTNSHLGESSEIDKKFWGRVPVLHTLAYLKFVKGGRVQRLLHALKYKNQPGLGELLGHWYGTDLKENGYDSQFDVIIPIPLHQSKLYKRGYNQSDYFAKGLSAGLDIPWRADVLVRQRKTQTQTKKKRFERWLNVDNVFAVDHEEVVVGKRILLVDDVLTTGATLEVGATALYARQCHQISIATIAAAL